MPPFLSVLLDKAHRYNSYDIHSKIDVNAAMPVGAGLEMKLGGSGIPRADKSGRFMRFSATSPSNL
jgi:hypothetical protein